MIESWLAPVCQWFGVSFIGLLLIIIIILLILKD